MSNTRIEFRILGPLVVAVDGQPISIGGPKQRALLALLLLSANRVVSRDRLIGDLFAEQSVNSADHALRNQVSRLRKVLGDEPRLTARAPGYLLRVEPGELDLERFERLVAAGRDALAADEPETAADAFRDAESLWRGRPFADLELEPFARIDVERLEELRLAAVEERIDADLALGRHRALVAELEAASAEHPFRERFRAQLMLALYRCGRQAEGLDVYRRTRQMLSDELGLEPGVELQELERAILVHDPALRIAADGRTPPVRVPSGRAVCPYKGLAPFDTEDAELFFGRERLVDELIAQLAGSTMLAVIGPSGSGKSSLLRAGLLPAIEGRCILFRPGSRPSSELEHALGAKLPRVLDELAPAEQVVIAVDQFEEAFAKRVDDDDRRAFIDALVDAAWDPDRRAVILFALRADCFGQLAPHVELADLVGGNHVLLGPMTTGELRRAIEEPAVHTGLSIEPELVDSLVDDLAREPGALPLLSTTLADLWRERQGDALTVEAYRRLGGVRGAVGRHAEAAYSKLDAAEQQVARRILLRLVAGGDGEALTRRRVTRAELDADQDEQVTRVLDVLVEKRLLIADENTVELVHEALLSDWPRVGGWLDADAQGRAVHRHLTNAAAEWAGSNRDSAELYRGARLAAALEWASGDGDAALNRLEREFLDASLTVFAREGERQRRTNRRLRGLLAAAVVLVVVALVAALLASAEWGSARSRATSADAERLGAQALVDPSLSRSLLLADAGVELDNSPATRSNLLAALLRSPSAIGVVRGSGGRVLDDTLSPDGRLLAVRGDDGTVAFFDTRTLREVGSRVASGNQLGLFGAIARPVAAMAFSPNGRTLAVGSSTGNSAEVFLVDTRTHSTRATPVSTQLGTADVAFAPDGRTFVTGEFVTGRTSPPPEVIVERRTSDGGEIRESRPLPAARIAGFVDHGRRLLVTTGAATSVLLDTRTLRRVRHLRFGGAAAVSRNGDVAAFGHANGGLVLVDLRTGAERTFSGRASGSIDALAFSRDGSVLASTSDDGGVGLWDVADASPMESYAGYATLSQGPVFSPDGSTLYSGGADGTVTAWDLSGERRLGRPFRFDPVPATGEGPQAAVSNASTATAVSPDSSLFATSPGPGRVTLWHSATETPAAELRGPIGELIALVFSHDGRLLVGSGDGSNAVVWNVATRKVVRVLNVLGESSCEGVAISPDDATVATACTEGALRFFDVRTGKDVGGTQGNGRTLQDVDFSRDGRLVAAAGLAGEIFVWDVRRRRLARVIPHGTSIFTLRFSPDGKTIAAGDSSGGVDFWNAVTGKQVGPTLGGQNGNTISVSFDPHGRRLVTTSSDGKLRLWDLTSGKLIGDPLPGSSTDGWGMFYPDGKHVIAVFASGTGVVWNVDPTAWAAHACRVANRDLTRGEWRDFVPGRAYRAVCP